MSKAITHEEARNAALVVVEIVAQRPTISEIDLVAALEHAGYSHLHSEKLCVFVPMAFAWALFVKIGVQNFPNHYVAVGKFGKEVEIPVAKEHYFTAALELAHSGLQSGWSQILTKQKFELVLARSAEYGTLNKALNAGKSLQEIKDAELLPPRVFRIAPELADEK